MKVHIITTLALALLLFGCGSKGGTQNEAAIRQAVVDHLASKGMDVNSMQIEISSLNFRKDEADATLVFRPKGSSDPSNRMSMNYTLERKGNGWAVKAKQEAGGTPHGGMSPEAMSPGAMPPGHPPAAGDLPAGHPPVSDKKEASGSKK